MKTALVIGVALFMLFMLGGCSRSVPKEEAHLRDLLDNTTDGWDATKYMDAVAFFRDSGDKHVPFLSAHWKEGNSHEYILAFLLHGTSYEPRLKTDLVKLLNSVKKDDQYFSAYALGMLYTYNDEDLAEGTRENVFRVLREGLSKAAVNDVGADFPKAIEHFRGVGVVN